MTTYLRTLPDVWKIIVDHISAGGNSTMINYLRSVRSLVTLMFQIIQRKSEYRKRRRQGSKRIEKESKEKTQAKENLRRISKTIKDTDKKPRSTT